MEERLDLQKYFPPVEDEEWENLISEDLSWQPIEGIHVQPYYRSSTPQPRHVFDHREWLIRADVDPDNAIPARDAGADALGFILHEDTELPENLPIGKLPLFFRGKGATQELIQTLRTRTVSEGYDPSQLRGAVVLSEQYSSHSALQAAEGTKLWTQVINLESWHDLGATHAQELACGLAQLSDLMAELEADCTAEHVYFRVPVGERYLLDIARLRALRLGAAAVLRAYNIHADTIHIVGVPSRRYESTLDPDTHLVRQTLQYTAAIIGGCNLIVSPNIGHNLRMLQILKHEGKLGLAADAAAGSWMVEHLTDALGHAAWNLFQTIEAKGGLRKAWSWIEQEIQRAGDHRNASVLSGKKTIVGVNTYLSDQIEEAALQEKSIIAPLEAVRLRTKVLGGRASVRVHGTREEWLDRLLDLCSCTIQNETRMTDLTVTETPQGFLIQNQKDDQALVKSGDSLPIAADRLLKLLEHNAA